MPEPLTGTSPLVVVIGPVNAGHVVAADAVPSPGETLLGRTAYVTLGGSGARRPARRR
ncbi:hypothetical protein [Streptomyces spongiicola]|uniref:hypothetical protein n=1 Tax=Streptomyces spongiicola TaxID=1690221 RepID=UPI001FEC772F|nr:hypothetical protein [Streptomyces spongiicola]